MKTDGLFFTFFFLTGHQIKSALSPNETITPAAKSILSLLHLPKILKKILAFFTRQTGGDPMASQLYDIMHTKSVVQDRKSIVARDVYRARWHEKWIEEGLDFVLTVPHPFPALENGTSEQTTLMSAGYTLIFNLVSHHPPVRSRTHTSQNIDRLNLFILFFYSSIIQPVYSQLHSSTNHSTVYQKKKKKKKMSFKNPKSTTNHQLPRQLIQCTTLRRWMGCPSVYR